MPDHRGRGLALALVCGAAAAVLVAVSLIVLSAHRDPPPVSHPWPTVLRTVDGQVTVVQPEDLD